MKIHRIVSVLFLMLAALVGCQQKQNPQEIREKTAEATSEAKRDALAVAQGLREGWKEGDQQLNINSASKEQLLTLPGMTDAEADRIIADRPYNDPGDLVTRRVIPKAEYDKIAGRITAQR